MKYLVEYFSIGYELFDHWNFIPYFIYKGFDSILCTDSTFVIFYILISYNLIFCYVFDFPPSTIAPSIQNHRDILVSLIQAKSAILAYSCLPAFQTDPSR